MLLLPLPPLVLPLLLYFLLHIFFLPPSSSFPVYFLVSTMCFLLLSLFFLVFLRLRLCACSPRIPIGSSLVFQHFWVFALLSGFLPLVGETGPARGPNTCIRYIGEGGPCFPPHPEPGISPFGIRVAHRSYLPGRGLSWPYASTASSRQPQ